MRQKKPVWAKTLVHWDIKKAIWWHWFLGLTLRQTTQIFKSSDKEYLDAPVTVDTVRKVRQELLDIPVELLDELVEEVPELETFIREKRPDYLEERPGRLLRRSPHTVELSTTALVIAKNFEKIALEPALSSDIPDCLGNVMFTNMAFTGSLNLEIIDEEKAADLFTHLKQEFSELKDIESWKLLKISKITSTLANRLELKAHQGKFKGRCPHCP